MFSIGIPVQFETVRREMADKDQIYVMSVRHIFAIPARLK
jgi:hypothetical protein